MSVYEVVSHIVIEADHFPEGSVPKMLELEKNPLYSLKKWGLWGCSINAARYFFQGFIWAR